MIFKTCEWSNCIQWAQYVATYPDNRIRIFCADHADEFRRMEPDSKVKIRFVGAMPDGLKDSKR